MERENRHWVSRLYEFEVENRSSVSLLAGGSPGDWESSQAIMQKNTWDKAVNKGNGINQSHKPPDLKDMAKSGPGVRASGEKEKERVCQCWSDVECRKIAGGQPDVAEANEIQ